MNTSNILKVTLASALITAAAIGASNESPSPGMNQSNKRPTPKLQGASDTGDRTLQSRSSSTAGSSIGTVDVTGARSDARGDQAIAEQQIVVPLHRETLDVDKRVVSDGAVRLRKVVRTETVNQPIELRRETLIVERVDADRAAPQSADVRMPGTFEEGEIVLSVSREEPVVQKRVVEGDRIVARTNVETERQNVTEQIRTENVEVVDRGGSRNVQIRGDLARSSEDRAEGVARR
jgi:uncharacterized protein (TIGR02271 family)